MFETKRGPGEAQWKRLNYGIQYYILHNFKQHLFSKTLQMLEYPEERLKCVKVSTNLSTGGFRAASESNVQSCLFQEEWIKQEKNKYQNSKYMQKHPLSSKSSCHSSKSVRIVFSAL